MNIAIVRAFIAYRKMLQDGRIMEQLLALKQRIDGHDMQLEQIYEAIENLLDGRADKMAWQDREKIGFRK
ncbi:hypothetical protein [Sediminibacterium soli]|uniref:hypothetical protein n=1 Tax=Sediminibacterium soli TaxID=2698829 RepID=UPI001F389549|nr:hypothetical protein [Sediminibacterium soli]